MKLLNRVELIGEVADNPTTRHLDDGPATCTFRLVTYEAWQDENLVAQYDYEWHHILVWDKLAEICEAYVREGMAVYVEGRLKRRTIENARGDSDQHSYITEVVANDVILLEYINREYGAERYRLSDIAEAEQQDPARYDPPVALDAATYWRLRHLER